MRTKNKAQRAGIRLYTEERVQIDHARYQHDFRSRVRRFARVQLSMLTIKHDLGGALAGRLVALDQVPVDQLHAALMSTAYHYRGMGCLEWTIDDELDRRLLSSFTVLSAASSRDTGAEVTALTGLLSKINGYKNLKASDALEQLELDRVAWSSQHLPKSLWSHVAGVRRFTLLRREDIANEQTGEVLDRLKASERAAIAVQVADMVDDAILRGRTLQTMPVMVDLARGVFKIASGLSEDDVLEGWGKGLLGLRAHVQSGDVAGALVVAWNFHLVVNGTATEVNARLKTRARYARVANAPLWRMLAGLSPSPDNWTASDFAAGYQSMMADPSCTDFQGLGAAIASFQSFLEEELGIVVETRGLHKLIPESHPRAKWIAPSATSRALGWLSADETGDPRLREIAVLMLRMAHAAAFRISELRWLRLRNVSFPKNGGLDIEVTPIEGVNPLKTEAAQRRIFIQDVELRDLMFKWVTKRGDEGAPLSAYLFGEPDADDKVYRPHAVHTLLIESLRRATGDGEITFHSMRHTIISNAVEAILLSKEVCAINRLTELACSSGHVVAETSFHWYSHRIELPLRVILDRELMQFSLSNSQGEALTGIKSNTLTQQALRHKAGLNTWIWQQIENQAAVPVGALQAAKDEASWTTAKAPAFTGPIGRVFTVISCMTVLKALAADTDPQLIENRHGVSRQQQSMLQGSAVRALESIYRARRELPDNCISTVKEVLADLGLDLSRADQPRYVKLVETLSLPQPASLLQASASAWAAAWHDGELRALQPSLLIPLLQFLRYSGVGAGQLQWRVQPDPRDAQWVDRFIAEAGACSLAVFNDGIPHTKLSTSRRDRGMAFLQWPSSAGVGPAGRSNEGLDALMFAIAVWSDPSLAAWRQA